MLPHLARVGGEGQDEPPAREVDEVLFWLAADGGGVGQGGGGGRELEEVPAERGRGLGGAEAGGGNALEMYEKMHVHDKYYCNHPISTFDPYFSRGKTLKDISGVRTTELCYCCRKIGGIFLSDTPLATPYQKHINIKCVLPRSRASLRFGCMPRCVP